VIQITDKRLCSGCHACRDVCVKQCIAMVADEEGFYYPVVDLHACIDCGLCETICPILHPLREAHESDGFACINTQTDIRMESSSGGVFSLLAQRVLDHSGIVFGAAFDTVSSIRHIAVESYEDLKKLRGSKYVQSDLSGILPQVKKYLVVGRLVLFSGTPCQIAGLRAYLRKQYDNLYCIDFVCHGVPSPKVWNAHVAYMQDKFKSVLTNVSFRDKSTGWTSYSTFLRFANGRFSRERFFMNRYMRLFLSNISLRPSCYACAFKTIRERQSDISLADFWGINRVAPKLNDKKGVSLVMLHTEKGRQLFESSTKLTEHTRINLEQAIKYNPSAIESSVLNRFRSRFFADFTKEGYAAAMQKYSSVTSPIYLIGLLYLAMDGRKKRAINHKK
jgi:coenzyme F420-reducing hydrogenase beta subunit